MRPALLTTLAAAALTGCFCAVFATVMYFIAPQVALWSVVVMSAASGFLGSLFARSILGRKNDDSGS